MEMIKFVWLSYEIGVVCKNLYNLNKLKFFFSIQILYFCVSFVLFSESILKPQLTARDLTLAILTHSIAY